MLDNSGLWRNGVYEGNEPYLFISYSHEDNEWMNAVKEWLVSNNIRFWYDSGLHAGTNWNLDLARRLGNAAGCLILLSARSVNSQYVRNEVIYAMNHQVTLYPLLLESFILPEDFALALASIQITEMTEQYQAKLLQAFPPDLYETDAAFPDNKYAHPLYQAEQRIFRFQGTTAYLGRHKRLSSPCLILSDPLKTQDREAVMEQAVRVSQLNHPAFPRLYDVTTDGNRVWTYQEYRGERPPEPRQMDEDSVKSWLARILDGLDYLFCRNLCLRNNFTRENLVLLDEGQIGFFRLQNLYYGAFPMSADMRPYCFERALQEIAAFLWRLCAGETMPDPPLGLLENARFSRLFEEKINLIIQKCVGSPQYSEFGEVRADLELPDLSDRDRRFLRERKEYAARYPKASDERNLCTSLLSTFFMRQTTPIRIRVCSSGQEYSFDKEAITVGRLSAATTSLCDLPLNSNYVSGKHGKIRRAYDKDGAATYFVQDYGSVNGIRVEESDGAFREIRPGAEERVAPGSVIQVADVALQLL